MLVSYVLIVISGCFIVFDMLVHYQTKIGIMFWIGFVLVQCFFPLSFILGNTMLAKVCNSKTRGTMFGFSGVLGSITVALVNAIADAFFKNNNILIFEIAFGNFLVLIIFILVLGLMGKLNK